MFHRRVRSSWRIILLLILLAGLGGGALRGQPAYLVRDIHSGPGTPLVEEPANYELTISGGRLFFIFDDGINGLELWTSDGTAAGTRLLRDICPGACPSRPRSLTSSNGLLFFAADDGSHGVELWKSDGTTAGTQLVEDIQPGLTGDLGGLLDLGGILYFAANEGVHGQELWRSDGTAAGTQLVKDINPGPGGSAPRLWAAGGGLLLLNAIDGTHGREPWISDGTEQGTLLLADIAAGNADSVSSELPYELGEDALALPGGGFLLTTQGSEGRSLHRTDGTPAGTTLLKTSPFGFYGFTAVGGTVFFGGYDPDHGTEPWMTDGTETGTVLVEDIRPGENGSFPVELTAVGGRLFFRAQDGIHGEELWVSDGTPAGTSLVKDIQPGPNSAFPDFSPQPPTFLFGFSDLGGELMFAARDGANGYSLWRSNGTDAGTVQVPSPPGTAFFPAFIFFEEAFLSAGGRFYYLGDGLTLWSTDGTTAGTVLLEDIVLPGSSIEISGGRSVLPRILSDLGGNLLFRANDGASGFELWRSDGTEAGTFLVQDLLVNGSSSPFWLTPVGGFALFTAFSGAGSAWRTDGTSAGTVPFSAPTLANLTALGGVAFFPAGAAGNGMELWQTDGTSAGTLQVKDIRPGSLGSAPEDLTVSGGTLFFSADDGSGRKLWRSDGTEAGTILVYPASSPRLLTDAGGILFYFASVPAGVALWKSDGTEAGTVLVKDLTLPSSDPFSPISPLPFYGVRPAGIQGGTLFFVAKDDTSGFELWKSDGTEAGTLPVKDIHPGPLGSDPHHLAVLGDNVYFSADDGVHGRELWVSDGTEAGTRLVEDIAPGEISSLPLWLRAEGSGLVFTASDGLHGMELWRSNGTELGTRMLQDISPGPSSSNPAELTPAGPNLYFAAHDGVTGYEPWAIPKTALTTFADVPTSHWAWPFIEALAVGGLTGGCGGDAFCPADHVTRAQTAVFLGRGIHGVDFTPPPATGTVFTDVPAGYWAAPWIEQLAADGLTTGCSTSPPQYCPEQSLTRAEIAVLLLKAKHGSSYTPPPATGTVFTDVPAGFWAAPWIEQLAAEGIATGCGGGAYCPGNPVNRAEMAVFLVRTFGLPLPDRI